MNKVHLRLLPLIACAILLQACTSLTSLPDYDVLCSGGFTEYETIAELKSKDGLVIPAGTKVKLRFCEPNAQAKLEFLVEKWDFNKVKPVPASKERWHYNVDSGK